MMLDKNKDAIAYLSETYQIQIESIQAKTKMLETPESIMQKEQTARTLELAKKVVDRGILNAETTDMYFEMMEKIEAKKQDITRFYGIDVDENSLLAIQKAYAVLSDKFSQELTEEDTAFQEKLEETKKDAQDKLAQSQEDTNLKVSEIQQKKKELEKEYQQSATREKEQYTYDLKRARKQAKEEREKIIAERESALKEKEAEAQEAKQKCLDKIKEISEMEAKVESIPALIEKAKQESATAKEKELNKDYGYHKMLEEKDNQNKINELQAELDRLEQKYDALLAEKEELSDKLDKCNAESRQLTSDTVKSIGGINILNTDNHAYNTSGKK
ncbi:MAG: hypothetical protein K2K06_02770 [Oscillospiraceae bacterium]|nr:hypothetical protein [Ruminococcus sp.]MDE6706945.1 hypothetical protein [Oscillospiraceae bacterium]